MDSLQAVEPLDRESTVDTEHWDSPVGQTAKSDATQRPRSGAVDSAGAAVGVGKELVRGLQILRKRCGKCT